MGVKLKLTRRAMMGSCGAKTWGGNEMSIRHRIRSFWVLAVMGALVGHAPRAFGASPKIDELRAHVREVPTALDVVAKTARIGMPIDSLVHCSLGRAGGGMGVAERRDWSADGRVLTVTLRAGTTYSDGTPVTSRDVVASYEMAVAAFALKPAAFASVRAVAAVDDRTTRFELERHDELLARELMFPIVKSGSRDAYQVGAPTCGEWGVESLEFPKDRGGGIAAVVTLRRHVAAMGSNSPSILRITFGGNRAALVSVMDLGKVDILVASEDATAIAERAKKNRGWTARVIEAGGPVTWLGVVGEDPVLSRPEARVGLAALIDRSAALVPVFSGLARSVGPMFAGTSDEQGVAFDVDRARGRLARVGLPVAARAAGSVPVVKWSIAVGMNPREVSVAKAVAADWAKYGFDTTVDVAGAGANSVFRLTRESAPWAWYRPSAIPACAAGCDKVVTGLIERWRGESDESRAAKTRVQIVRAIEARYPVIPLWHENLVVVERQGIANVRPSLDGDLAWLADVSAL